MKQKLLLIIFLLFGFGLTAQTHFPLYNPKTEASVQKEDTDNFEKLVGKWNSGVDKVQKQVHASNEEFDLFSNFYQGHIDSGRTELIHLIEIGKVSDKNIVPYISNKMQQLLSLYSTFVDIKKKYPSSVTGNALPPANVAPTCNAACTNMNFASGNYTGWFGYYATNSSTTSYKITGQTGGSLGASIAGAAGQLKITKAVQNDWFLSNYHSINMSQSSPWGVGYSSMLGDSIEKGGKVAILSQKFKVTATTNSITYAYSVFLENPGHTYYEQPFFSVTLFDQNGDTITNCGVYNVVSQVGLNGFVGEYYLPRTDTIYWKDWTQVNVPLTNYVGQCVTIQFEVSDCQPSGHCGYAYVDASCSTFTITASAPAICGPMGTLNLDGPVGESHYAWTGPGGGIVTNDTLQDVTVDKPGTYTLVITPVTGALCKDTLHYTVIQDTISVTANATNILCNGGTGSASAVEANGTGPFTYAWTPSGKTTASATGLSAGSYTVSVTDKYACPATASVTITQPPALTAAISGTNLPCGGSGTGGASVLAGGGTSPYTYLWNPSGQTNASATGLSAGNYTVTVTDNNGCVKTASIAITQPPVLTATMGAQSAIPCFGGTANITVTAGGGASPYTYLWNPTGQTNAAATGLTAGSYTVTITDASGCTATASIAITQPAQLTATITAQTNILCNGGTGNATVVAAGGKTAYTYLWTPNGGTNGTGTGLSAGSYTVTVTDHNGCTATASVTITQPPALTANITPTDPLCNGGTGSAVVAVGGGISPYTYLWHPNGGTNASATGLTVGSYTVNVKDANGCQITASVTITQPPVLTATMGAPTNVLCNGGSNGSASVTAGGGTAPYTYLWAPGGSTNASETGLTAGGYTVTITDNNGCTATASITITQPPVLTATMGAPTNVLCNGGTGSAMVTAGGGTSPYTYAWAPGGNTNANATGLTAGSYTVTVTDHDGCTATASVTITQPPVLTATMGAPTNVLCNGGTGSAMVTAGGGTSPYTYAWAPGGNTNANATNLTAGSYTVTVTDHDGCTATASVTITQPPVLTATMGAPTNVLCNGGNNGSAMVTAGGGTSPYTYLWAPTGQTNATATGLTAGSYTVTVTDHDGCVKTVSVTITQPPVLTATMGAPTNVLCNGGSNGSAMVTAGGGTAPYTYLWNPTGQTNANATGLTAGSYTVTVTDNDGCTATASVTITQPPVLTATMGAPTNVLCNGGNNGSAMVTAGGGTSPYTYAWAPGGNTNANATGLTAGSYTVTVTDHDGCTATASVTITQPPVLTATMGAPTNVLCNGGNNGSAMVTAGGGTAPYTYLWAPGGNTNANATGLTAGSYTVTVTDHDGCVKTVSVTITQPPVLTATMGAPTNVLCNGGNNGSAMVTAGGGTAPYTYLWAPTGQTNATATGLTAGSYTVTVTDNDGCVKTVSVTITQPPVLTATMGAPTNVLCNGGTGSAMVTAGGGTSPYTYAWAPGGNTNANATGLTAGSYTVTVTDHDGCTATASVTITQPPVLTATMGAPTNVLCNGGTGSAMVTAGGGTSPYTYAWAPGGNTNANATGLTAGSYTVTIKDADGCTATASVTITQPPVLTATMGAPTNVLCNGGNNGSAMVTAGGGTAPYTYLWNPTGQTNANATGLTAGSYTVTVTDNDGCVKTVSVTITQPPVLTATMGAPTNVLCNGGTGSAMVTAGGGTSPYTYAWAPGGNTNANATGLTAGSYTVTVTDHDGCTATASVTITQPPVLTATMGAPTNVLCNGGTGSAMVTAGGGTSPYTYAWAPGGNTNANATNLTAGSYTVTVTDHDGCTATASVTITQPPVLTATMGAPTNVLCNGGNNGSAMVTAGGGTSPYTYLWAPTGQTNATATGLTAGSYTVTVTDNDGCVKTASVTITQPLPLGATPSSTQATCNLSNGSASVIATGGTVPYTYLWNPGGNTNANATGLSAGNYTVTITDNDGCTLTASIAVTEPSTVTATMGAPTNVLCNGGTGSAMVTAGGGTSPYTYAWAPGGNTNANATGLTAGSYTVTVTDNNGCIATASVTITQPPILTATMGAPTNVLCNGGNNGSAMVTAGGGTAPYTYLWNPTGQTNANATGLTAGSYTVTVTDNHGCITTASVTITQPPVLTATMGAPTNVLCNGGSNGSAMVTAGGGTAPYTYLWAPTGQTNANATGLTAGSYTVTVTDNDGCVKTVSVTITQPPVLTATMGAPTNVLCNGGTGSAMVTAGGGTVPYTYAWAPGGNTNANATGLTAGSYTVTVTDNDGCTATASVTITQAPVLTATMGAPTNVLCNGGSNGSAMVTAGGGTVPYTYLWAPGGNTNANATGLTAGSYTVTVTDNHGCTATASVTITQPPVLTATMGAPTNVLCNGGNNASAMVTAGGGTAPYTYLWNPTGQTNANATGLTAGSYTVTITDNNGCVVTASVTITQPLPLGASTSFTQASCNLNNGSATVNVTGGTVPYTYLWNPSGQTNATATGISAGSYTVTVTDNDGCVITASVTVTQPSAVTATIGASINVLCNGGNNASAMVTAGGGTAPYTYLWNPTGQTNANATGLTAGSYTVTVTDNNGCSITASVTITQPIASLAANASVTTNVDCNGNNNASALSSPSGGTGPYTYSWNPTGQTNASATGLTAGSYTVTVTDNNGCTATASVTITQPIASLAANASVTANVNCNGNNNASALSSPSGGTGPYTYSWNPTGQTNASATGLTAGSYTVTVTDNHGCTATASVTITQPIASLAANASVTTNVDCNGNNNASALSSPTGGTGPYTYSWNPTGQTNASATGLTAGSYTVTVTDNNGCTVTASVTITQPIASLAANASVTANVDCNGNNNASAISSPTGGTGPYTYSWNPTGQTNASATGLTAGSYTVTVTDNHGCTATASVTITQPIASLAANASVTTNVDCNGNNNASALSSPSGGTGPYTYSWNPTGQTNASATGLTAGSYTVTVTDNHGCTATASVTITQPIASLAANASVTTNVDCNGNNNAIAISNPSGGTGPYTYSWNPTGQTNASATGLTAGSYTVTVTDNHGCTATASVTITQPIASLAANASVTANVNCNGNNNAIAISNPSGGTGPYTYSWNPTGQTNASATGLTAGSYTVTVTDNHGCTTTASVTITQPIASLSANASVTANVLCNGGNNASATVIAGGGTTPYTYSWNPTGQTNASATGLTAGSYTVTVTDNHGCTATASVTITQPTVLTATMGVPVNELCNGGNNANVTVTAGGGTTPYAYSWNPTAQTNAHATGLTAGSYTVTIKDADGCIATASVIITQPNVLTAVMGATNNVLCNGGTGTATVNVVGGTVPYAYAWAPLGGSNATGTGLSAGIYVVTVTDADGCSATASVSITQPNVLGVIATGPLKDCSGAPITIVANVTGGTTPYAYNWAPVAGASSNLNAAPLVTTTYTVTITDAHGCTATAVTTVDVSPPLSVVVIGDTVICPGGRVIIKANAIGGDGIYNYLWLPSNLTTQTVVFSPTKDTTVIVQVTDGCGSTMVSQLVHITIEQYPISAFGGDVLSGCVPLCIQFRDYSSSAGIAQWNWNFGNGDSLSEQSPIFCYKDTGTYSVTLTVTSKIGCSGTLKIDNMIHVYPPPRANFTYTPQPVNIIDPEVQFTDLSTGRYPIVGWNWRFGQGDSTSVLRNPTHFYPDTGTYCPTLTVMDIHGCIDSITNCFVVNPLFGFYIPDAFTPNGDGVNDAFIPKGTYIKDFEMYIFDRWGMKIFHTTDINHGWDGTVNGGSVIAQEDVYVYKINVTDAEGGLHSYIGRVTLLK